MITHEINGKAFRVDKLGVDCFEIWVGLNAILTNGKGKVYRMSDWTEADNLCKAGLMKRQASRIPGCGVHVDYTFNLP